MVQWLSSSSTPPPPQIAFLPPNLALTAVHAFSFHLDSKKWERFFMNSLPTSGHYWSFLVQSSSTALYFQVWLIDEQPDEKRNKQQFSESESWPLLPLFIVLEISKKILVPHLYWIGFLVTIRQRFISGLNGMVIKVASHCGLPQTEYNLITLNMKEVLNYPIHH